MSLPALMKETSMCQQGWGQAIGAPRRTGLSWPIVLFSMSVSQCVDDRHLIARAASTLDVLGQPLVNLGLAGGERNGASADLDGRARRAKHTTEVTPVLHGDLARILVLCSTGVEQSV
ncbi:hypothetical protein [Microvirga sp. P5_D2]